jgi:hypothetical protein
MRPRSLAPLLLALVLTSAPAAAQEYPLTKCDTPRQPLGYLRGEGEVTYLLRRDGRPDTASISVLSVSGISAGGYRSAVVRQLSACRMARPEESAKLVRQRVRFDSTQVLMPAATVLEGELPVEGFATLAPEATVYARTDSQLEERPRLIACDRRPLPTRTEVATYNSRAEAMAAAEREARLRSGRVRARFVVGADGRVIGDSTQVLESDNPGVANDLINSLNSCRFTPARIGGTAVPFWLIQGSGIRLVTSPP